MDYDLKGLMQKGIVNLLFIIALLGISLIGFIAYFLFPYGFDLLNDRYIDTYTNKNQGKIVWQHPVKDRLVQDFIFYNGKIYFTTKEGILYSLSGDTGRVLWTYSYGQKMDSNTTKGSSILADNNIIFIESTFYNPYFNNYIAIDSETGEEKWIKRFDNTIGTIAVEENVSIIMERFTWEDQYLKALDNDTGQEIWSYPLGNQNTVQLSIVESVVYFFHSQNSTDLFLEAIDLFTGSVKWTHKLDGSYEAFLPFKVNDLIIFGQEKEDNHSIKALDVATGTLKWSSKSGILFQPPQLWDNTLIFLRSIKDKNTESNFIASIDAKTGTDKWASPISNYGSSNIIVDQEKVYFSDDKYFYSFNANTGKQIWRNSTAGDTDPVIKSNNLIFYREFKSISFPDSFANFPRALNSENGRVVWSWKKPAYHIVKGGNSLVYFESENTIYALQSD